MQKTHKTGDEVLSKDQTYTNANLKGVFKTHENNTLFTGLDYVSKAWSRLKPARC